MLSLKPALCSGMREISSKKRVRDIDAASGVYLVKSLLKAH
jgi:hypothetical protein